MAGNPPVQEGRDQRRNEANLDFGVAEFGPGLRDDKIAGRSQTTTTGNSRTSNCGHSQFGMSQQYGKQIFKAARIRKIVLGTPAFGDVLEGGKIRTGTEVLARTGQNDGPNERIVRRGFKRTNQCRRHLRRQRVGPVGLVEGQDHQGTVGSLQHDIAHQPMVQLRPDRCCYHEAMAQEGRPWVTTAGILIALIGIFWMSRSDPRDRVARQRNVVVILIDTLRADHVGLYGYGERATTPNIDDLGRQGRWFESAWSTAPWTVPSIMSLMTSLYPAVHGFNLEGQSYASTVPLLSPSIHTLAEVLGSNGYETLAVTGGGGVGTVYGFDRGFDRFFQPESMTGEDVEAGVDLALEWLQTVGDQPFLLFFHTYEVHLPNTHRGFTGATSPRNIAREAYDNDLAFADQHLGRLFEALPLDNTLVVITADHGENLYDRDLGDRPVEHGHHLHDELLHVPLIFIAPGLLPDSGAIPGQVQLTDVMPTILSLVDVDSRTLDIQGADLRGQLQGWSPAPLQRPIYAGAPLQGPDWHMIRTPTAKLMVTPPIEGTNWWNHIHQPSEALYLLSNDPLEKNNLFNAQPEIASDLKAVLDHHLTGNSALRRALGRIEFVPVHDDITKLEALGYIERPQRGPEDPPEIP